MFPRSFLVILGASRILADSCPDVSTVTVLTSVTEFIPATTLSTLNSVVSTETDVDAITSAIISTVTETVSSNVTPTSYIFLPGGPPSSSSATPSSSTSPPSKRDTHLVNIPRQPICNRDNCLRALRATSIWPQVQSFCKVYTTIPENPLPLPTFVPLLCGSARVSSACSCLVTASSTSLETATSMVGVSTTSKSGMGSVSPIATSSSETTSSPTSSIALSTTSESSIDSAPTTSVVQSESSSGSAPTSIESPNEPSSAPTSTSELSSVPCTTITSMITTTLTISLPSLAATNTILFPLTATTLLTQNALTTSFTTTTTTLFPPAITTTGYPCHNIRKYSGPTYGDVLSSDIDLQRQNFLYSLKTPQGASTESCCNLCFFGLENCVQAYWYSYQGCVVSQAPTVDGGVGGRVGGGGVCPGGQLGGLVYGNDAAPAYGTTGNIAGPCGSGYLNYWQTD